jgi:general secretion pathway protein K
MSRAKFRHPRRGAALIVVLATLLALVPSVYSLLDTSFTHTREPALLADECRAGILAESGLNLAMNLLLLDEDPLSDTPREPWCGGRPGPKGRPLPVWDSRGLTVTVIPCNAYLNLNAVLVGDEPTTAKPNPSRERMEKALGALLLTQKKAPTLILSLQDWIDDDNSQRLPGAEGMAYAAAGRGYTPSNEFLLRPEEALLVAGWETLDPDWLRALFTAWGAREPKVNINFAPVAVLEALLPELIPARAQVVAFRDSQGFLDASQLMTVAGLDEETYAKAAPFLTVLSDQFQILVRAEAGGWVETRRYVVERSISIGRVKVLCRDVISTVAAS